MIWWMICLFFTFHLAIENSVIRVYICCSPLIGNCTKYSHDRTKLTYKEKMQSWFSCCVRDFSLPTEYVDFGRLYMIFTFNFVLRSLLAKRAEFIMNGQVCRGQLLGVGGAEPGGSIVQTCSVEKKLLRKRSRLLQVHIKVSLSLSWNRLRLKWYAVKLL